MKKKISCFDTLTTLKLVSACFFYLPYYYVYTSLADCSLLTTHGCIANGDESSYNCTLKMFFFVRAH